MIFLSIFLTLCLTFRLGHAVGLHGFHFRGLKEPEPSMEMSFENIIEAWIEQPVDHFNLRDNRTWSMRYYENSGHFKKGGPILIMIGGEWAISRGFLQSGLMFELGCTHNAMMYYTEHRYYGKSRPTKDTSSRNLVYLSVEQALADLAYFIESKKRDENLRNSKVIVFGGSYSGGLAAWSRLKYPHLIQGALASSAPIFTKVDFYEYYEGVAESLRKYSQKCVDDIKAAFDEVEVLLTYQNGLQYLKTYFNLCDMPNVQSPSDVGQLMSILAEQFASNVQYNSVQNGKTNIDACCEYMTSSYLGSPVQRLAYLMSTQPECLQNNYEKFLNFYRNESWGAESDIMRLWFYQTCTEFGNYQTTNSKKSIFGTLLPLSYYTDMCTDLYGDYYNSNFLNTRVERTNIMYGGLQIRPDLRNVIFTNGDVDPWHSLSVLKDLNPSVVSILINGSSHCGDLYSDSDTDSKDLLRARAQVRQIIGSWISS